ncbi:MAG TPA: ribosome biogenesis GTP-binding protein YihA/YsxC [Terriglobales bacterium]|nr:ribosome biogenesis GTP-binding protein YihA/YsxC [Terriglobales bacterium]
MRFEVAFVKSCSAITDLPLDSLPEVAILGRSNVGKSSLLNSLAAQKKLAKTSRTPGRTRLLNLFAVNGDWLRLVDCPGYGYAKVSHTERAKWGALIEPYLAERPNLAAAVLLVDSMLEPQPLDLDLNDWLRGRQIPTLLVATKTDRLSGNQLAQAMRQLTAAFGAAPLAYSSVRDTGGDALRCQLLSVRSASPAPARSLGQ